MTRTIPTGAGTSVSSRIVPSLDPSVKAYKIDLLANTFLEVSPAECFRVATAVASATGKSLEELRVAYVV